MTILGAMAPAPPHCAEFTVPLTGHALAAWECGDLFFKHGASRWGVTREIWPDTFTSTRRATRVIVRRPRILSGSRRTRDRMLESADPPLMCCVCALVTPPASPFTTSARANLSIHFVFIDRPPFVEQLRKWNLASNNGAMDQLCGARLSSHARVRSAASHRCRSSSSSSVCLCACGVNAT